MARSRVKLGNAAAPRAVLGESMSQVAHLTERCCPAKLGAQVGFQAQLGNQENLRAP